MRGDHVEPARSAVTQTGARRLAIEADAVPAAGGGPPTLKPKETMTWPS
jgi:hypothetical protein